jgi:ribonuclease T2
VIEQTFLEANPKLRPEGVTVTCKADHIQEVRICLTRDLAPRPCGRDVARDCTAPSLFTPVR